MEHPFYPESLMFEATGSSSGGKHSFLDYRLAHDAPDLRKALFEIDLGTGRTHQIRVQLSDAGFPVVGDQLYNPQAVRKLWETLGEAKHQTALQRWAEADENDDVPAPGAVATWGGKDEVGMALQAYSLTLPHPLDPRGEPISAQLPMPEAWQTCLGLKNV